MAERFGTEILRSFRNAFRTVGGSQLPQEIAVDRPIQPVVDVGTFARDGVPISTGFVTTHAIAGTAQAQVTGAQMKNALRLSNTVPDPEEVDFWILGIHLWITTFAQAAAFSNASAGIMPDPRMAPSPGNDNEPRGLIRWDSYVAAGAPVAGQDGTVGLESVDNVQFTYFPLQGVLPKPVLWRPDDAAVLWGFSNASGAITQVRFTWDMRVVPRGVYLP